MYPTGEIVQVIRFVAGWGWGEVEGVESRESRTRRAGHMDMKLGSCPETVPFYTTLDNGTHTSIVWDLSICIYLCSISTPFLFRNPLSSWLQSSLKK